MSYVDDGMGGRSRADGGLGLGVMGASAWPWVGYCYY